MLCAKCEEPIKGNRRLCVLCMVAWRWCSYKQHVVPVEQMTGSYCKPCFQEYFSKYRGYEPIKCSYPECSNEFRGKAPVRAMSHPLCDEHKVMFRWCLGCEQFLALSCFHKRIRRCHSCQTKKDSIRWMSARAEVLTLLCKGATPVCSCCGEDYLLF